MSDLELFDGIGCIGAGPLPVTAPCPAVGPPTLSGFQSFIVNVMGISTTILPPTDPVVCMAYTIALEIVNQAMRCASLPIYTLAVYNLGGSNIINFAQDQGGASIYQNDLAFFAYLRKKWNISGFVSGIIQSSSDVSTSESMVIPDVFKNFTLADLQYLKDPYGRQYMSFAQRYGTLWGMN